MAAERLQKVLASAGIASRRDCEALISAGRVTVNGRVVHELGTRVDPEQDMVAVDGKPVQQPVERTYLMLNKPVGVVSTADDPQGRPTVVELVDVPGRVYPVGRLDADSEGLLLLTDDGELTHRLTHPSFSVEKEYRVLLDSAPDAHALREWRTGVMLDEERTAPAWVEVMSQDEQGVWVRVVLREGRKRQIREVARLLGYEVLQLIRVREGSLELGDLPNGQWRNLTEAEVQALQEHARHVKDDAPAAARAVGGERAARPRRAERDAPGGNEAEGRSAPYRQRSSVGAPRPKQNDRSGFRQRDEGGYRSESRSAGRRDEGSFRGNDRGESRGYGRRDEGGFRGNDRGESRGGFRGNDRGNDRSESRGYGRRDEGGFRGNDRSESRGFGRRDEGGFRGNDRGESRGFGRRDEGGFRGNDRGESRGFGRRDEGGYRGNGGGGFRGNDRSESRGYGRRDEGGFRGNDRSENRGNFRRDEGGFRGNGGSGFRGNERGESRGYGRRDEGGFRGNDRSEGRSNFRDNDRGGFGRDKGNNERGNFRPRDEGGFRGNDRGEGRGFGRRDDGNERDNFRSNDRGGFRRDEGSNERGNFRPRDEGGFRGNDRGESRGYGRRDEGGFRGNDRSESRGGFRPRDEGNNERGNFRPRDEGNERGNFRNEEPRPRREAGEGEQRATPRVRVSRSARGSFTGRAGRPNFPIRGRSRGGSKGDE